MYTVYTRSIYWMSYLFFCKSRPFGTAVPPGPERKLWPRAVSPAPEWWRPIGEIWGMGMNGVPLFWETRYQYRCESWCININWCECYTYTSYNHYVNANMQNSPQFGSRKTYGKLEEICIFTREPPEISSAGHLWNLWVQLFLWKLIVQGGSLAVRSSLDTQMAGTVDPR